MTRKNANTTEIFPEGGAKQAKSEEDPELNKAIDATEGVSEISGSDFADANEGDAAPATAGTPKVQEAGNFPSAADAFADMSQPPPAPPVELLALNHGSQVPREAFRVIPHEKYVSLYMFNMPFGTSMAGEAYVQPVAAGILDQFRKECPQLVLKRFEIRLLQRADGSFFFLEVPADPAGTLKAEATRNSLLRLLKVAEGKWVIAEKVGGIWGVGDATCATPPASPAQSYMELIHRTYGDEIHRDMNRPVLQRFRKKV
jgi:hypothetical protein